MRNPKSDTLNPKQIPNSKQNHNNIWDLGFRYCLEFSACPDEIGIPHSRENLGIFITIILFLGSFVSVSLGAEVIDRIVAIVGEKVIVQSEIEEALFLLPNADRTDILDQLIERELLLVEAKKETLAVESEELEDAVEKAILDVRGRFPSDEKYELELKRAGLTEEELRIKYGREMEGKILIQKLFQKKFGKELAVGDIEVIDFYNTHLDSIPPQPDAVKFFGVVVYYRISDEAKAVAKSRADNILHRIKGGFALEGSSPKGKESFALLAKKYSDDPISREKGGDLGSLNIRDLGKDFQSIVGDMVAGEAAIVPAFDAYHIVRCNEKHEEMVNLSAIVIKMSPTHADSQATQEIVDSVAKSLEMEKRVESPNTMSMSWGDDFVPLSATPFRSLESIKIGKIYTFDTPNGFQVIKPIEKSPGHTPTWEEIREELKNLVYQRKLQSQYESLINKLKEEVFVKKML